MFRQLDDINQENTPPTKDRRNQDPKTWAVTKKQKAFIVATLCYLFPVKKTFNHLHIF
jgi:hypothetical protein